MEEALNLALILVITGIFDAPFSSVQLLS